MCRDVTTFVVGVDGNVKAEELNESLLVPEAQEIGEVVRIILGVVNGRELSRAEDIAVDSSSNVGKLGNTKNRLVPVPKAELKTHRSIESSNVGPQYSFFEIPSW